MTTMRRHLATRTALLLSTCAVATAAHAGEMTGQVADATGTRALQAATVAIPALNRSVATDRDGRYLLADIPAGEYEVAVSYVGATTLKKTVQVPAEGRITADFSVAAVGGAEILVIGQAANQASALSRQKAADGVSSVLTRDAIGQFPDQNVAESLRRLPGINILNDQGEGRYVSVRGLDPELNATSLNGVRLPSPESDVRSVALDVISSDSIESIEVKKSLTPDMDADTIGASIEIKTTSAFDRKKPYLSAGLEGSYNDYSGKVMPKGNVDFATRLTDNLGIAGSFSYYRRKFETDNIETGGDWKTSKKGVVYNDEVQYRDYDVTRTRLNGGLSIDYRASDTTKLYVRGNYSQFDDHEYRRRTTFKLKEPTAGDDDSATFSDAGGTVEVRRDTKDRFERQRIRTVSFGGETDTGEWKADWQGSWAKSGEKEDFSLDPTRFVAKFSKKGVALTTDYSDPRTIGYAFTGGAALVNDPSQYKFNRVELTTLSDSQDEEWAAKANLARVFATEGGTFTLQGGAKARWRTKSYNYNMTYFGNYTGSYTLADVLGEQTYRLADIGPVSSATGPTDFFLAHRDSFGTDAYETALQSAVSDYSVKENVLAGYMLGRWDSDTLRIIGGVRMERTWNRLDGNRVTDDGSTVTGIAPIRYERHYTDWLPSLTLRFSPQNAMVFRLAGYKSLVRPKLSKMAPRYMVNEDNQAEFGNPALKPYVAWNFDAGWDYYFSGNGAVSVNGFYKSIRNFIVDATYYDYSYEGATYDRFITPVNGSTAEVAGVEASYSQLLNFLPAPLDGLLVQANYTYTYTRGTIYDADMNARRIGLPSSSRNTFNLVLGYEKGPISLRAAGTYRDKYLDEIGATANTDRYVDNHFQLDLSAKYRVTDNVRVFAEWVNVNNAKYFAYQNYDGRQRLLQFEKYGPTIKAGVKVNF